MSNKRKLWLAVGLVALVVGDGASAYAALWCWRIGTDVHEFRPFTAVLAPPTAEELDKLNAELARAGLPPITKAPPPPYTEPPPAPPE